MAVMDVRLVAMDRPVWEGQARLVVVRTPEGEIGIMADHEPMLALLVDGPVRIETTDGEKLSALVHEGFFSIVRNRVAILAESAELDSEIDAARAQRALDRILADGTVDSDEKAAEVRARGRLRVAMGAGSATLHQHS